MWFYLLVVWYTILSSCTLFRLTIVKVMMVICEVNENKVMYSWYFFILIHRLELQNNKQHCHVMILRAQKVHFPEMLETSINFWRQHLLLHVCGDSQEAHNSQQAACITNLDLFSPTCKAQLWRVCLHHQVLAVQVSQRVKGSYMSLLQPIAQTLIADSLPCKEHRMPLISFPIPAVLSPLCHQVYHRWVPYTATVNNSSKHLRRHPRRSTDRHQLIKHPIM